VSRLQDGNELLALPRRLDACPLAFRGLFNGIAGRSCCASDMA